MGNRALRRQQAKTKTKEGAGSKSGRAGRAIPSTGPKTKTQQTRRASGGGILSWRPRIIMDIWSELGKVVWPERGDVVHLTIVIVIVTVMIGAVLGLIDVGFGWLIDRTLLN